MDIVKIEKDIFIVTPVTKEDILAVIGKDE